MALYGLLFSLLFYIAIPIPEVIQCYHLFLHFPIVHAHQLTTGRAGFCFCFLFVLFAFWRFCLFSLFLRSLCLLFVLHGDSSMDYVSIQFSSFCLTLSL